MTKSKVALNTLPQTVTAYDPHEFREYENVFESLGLDLTIEELGCNGVYHAIIFKPSCRPNSYIEQLISSLNDEDGWDDDEDDLSCPGCGRKAGEGLTDTCSHMEGCGHYKAFSADSD